MLHTNVFRRERNCKNSIESRKKIVMNIAVSERRGPGSLHEHMLRILQHLDDIDRSKFESVGEYVEELSRYVKDAYAFETVHALPQPAPSPQPTRKSPAVQESLSLTTHLQCLSVDNELLRLAGFGMCENASIEMQLLMRDLAISLAPRHPRRTRLWGKLIGLACDFYIVEVQFGLSFIYFATSNPTIGKWQELGPASPADLALIEKAPKLIMGSDDYPRIRAMIARISTMAAVAPSGQLVSPFEFDSTFDPTSVDLTDPTAWVYSRDTSADIPPPIDETKFNIRTRNGVTAVTSTAWPGAVTVSNCMRTVFMYIGTGLSSAPHPVLSSRPQPVCQEPAESTEQPEPTASNLEQAGPTPESE